MVWLQIFLFNPVRTVSKWTHQSKAIEFFTRSSPLRITKCWVPKKKKKSTQCWTLSKFHPAPNTHIRQIERAVICNQQPIEIKSISIEKINFSCLRLFFEKINWVWEDARGEWANWPQSTFLCSKLGNVWKNHEK